MIRRLSLRATGIGLIVLLVVAWELAVRLQLVDSPSIPSFSASVAALVGGITDGTLPVAMGETLSRVLVGYVVAVVAAVVVGALMGTSRFVYYLLEPVTELLRPIPSAAYIPIAILLLGVGSEMKIAVIALTSFFPVVLSTCGGVRSVDPILVDTGRTLGYGPLGRLRRIVLPSALPETLTGMRVALGIALIVGIVSEMLAGDTGIGYLILESQRIFQVPLMFAGIITLALVGYLLNLAFVRVESHLLRWRTA
ncbi:ABC transporter permease [Pseudonocardia kujensis]|uniref:ABC transporter permease n=1 Tax=Pseudonocardia kujensis TaxID=1128675 RepID=UPI001E29C04F|nr:ABC transporter permease [Pseudonocardia kujensis]MCE0762061.1 ABC transporter permease [Pseudonocardia kujensis]